MIELLAGCPDVAVRAGAALARHTTFGIGGPATWLAEPGTIEACVAVIRRATAAGVPLHWLGGGSNLLVPDAGVEGCVVRTRRLDRLVFEGDRARAEAGVGLARLVATCARRGLAGAEVLAGIPGTVGGAIAMNAGGRHGEIADLVETVETVAPDGARRTHPQTDCGFAYRTAELRGEAVVAATLRLRPADPGEAHARLRAILAAKAATQPLRARSAGCVFRNPRGTDARSAGALIDAAGCKGVAVGDATVSQKHANFIVNRGQARATDVLALAALVRDRVRERFGVTLEPEIRLWGLPTALAATG